MRIEDYGLIGDLQTAALVGLDGSIDWLCFPRFDSGACFAALLGTEENGRWLLAPDCEIRRVERRYRDRSLVHELEFHTDAGIVRVIDFMPPRGTDPDLVRIVEGVQGSVPMLTELVLRFDYGSVVPWVRRIDGGTRVAVAGPDAVCLETPVELHGENMRTIGEFTVSEGERLPFVLTWFPSHHDSLAAVDPEVALQETCSFWGEWLGSCSYGGRWSDAVERSLMVLKAMTYEPTGGIVAAPTTSLPERIGGVRNWDYRYCWLRDATFALHALVSCGFIDEARAWRRWLLRAVAGDPDDLQIMYGPAGERRLTELELPWLEGYERSQPVRIGNGASNQFQLDVYGEVLDVLHAARRAKLETDETAWTLQKVMLESLEHRWREPDEGIWEVRGPRRHFTHSKVMAWVAFDRAVLAVEQFGRDGPVERWREIRNEIHVEVMEKRLRSAAQLLRRVVRLEARGRKPADDPAGRLSPSHPPRRAGDARARARGAPPGRVRAALRPRRGDGLGRRPAAGRGLVLPLLVLVRRQPGDARRAGRGGRDVRTPPLAAQRSRPPVGGVRRRRRAGSSATSRRPSRTSVS